MIVRNGHHNSAHTFHIGSREISLCSNYKYLGITITDNGNFNAAIVDLKSKASKAYYKLLKITSKCSFPIHLRLKLFDALVKPIMLYNSEIWGLQPRLISGNEDEYGLDLQKLDRMPYEQLHHKFCKNILHVPMTTTNLMCKAELGRYPMIFDIITASIKYLNRLQNTSNTILSDAYKYYLTSKKDAHNWKNNIDKFISATKLTIPQNNTKSELKRTVATAKKCLVEQHKGLFFRTINKSATTGKFTLYQNIYKEYKLQNYLLLQNSVYKQTISRLRTSTHKLQIETGRHCKPKTPRQDRKCKRCNMNTIEDETHFLLYCTSLNSHRSALYKSLETDITLLSDTQAITLLLNPQGRSGDLIRAVHEMYKFRLNLPVVHSSPCT
jgi:hypothetical protein